MKIGFIIICRFNSARLPGKILRKIKGKTVLQYIIERLECVVSPEEIVVATSSESSDDPIVNFCNQNGLQCYRGSLNNVAERFLHCAEEYKFDYASRINGDNIFVDISILNQMRAIALRNEFDFISNVKERTFPKGMSIEIVRSSYYRECYHKFSDGSHYEHVTLYLYQNDHGKKHFYLYNTICRDAAGIQLAIDTEEDFFVTRKIISNFTNNHTSYGLTDIYRILNERLSLYRETWSASDSRNRRQS